MQQYYPAETKRFIAAKAAFAAVGMLFSIGMSILVLTSSVNNAYIVVTVGLFALSCALLAAAKNQGISVVGDQLFYHNGIRKRELKTVDYIAVVEKTRASRFGSYPLPVTEKPGNSGEQKQLYDLILLEDLPEDKVNKFDMHAGSAGVKTWYSEHICGYAIYSEPLLSEVSRRFPSAKMICSDSLRQTAAL